MTKPLIVLAAIAAALSVPAAASAAPPPFGGLTQLAGTAACISASGTGGACAVGHGFGTDGYPMMAISADGRNIYAPQDDASSLAVLQRDPATGTIAQLAGTAGCVSEDGTGGQCATGKALAGVKGVAVSPDGRNVYVAAENSGAVAAFARDTTTGALTQLAGTAGCISNDGSSGACVDGAALGGARGIAISPDGKTVYAASNTSNAVDVFSRDPSSGALTQLGGAAACVATTTADGCTAGKGLDGARDVQVTPDGTTVYVAGESGNAVAVFSRNSGSGALTQLPGTAGCVSRDGSSGACSTDPVVENPRSIGISPDGANVYVTGLNTGMAIFSRQAGGELTPLPADQGCVSGTGPSGCGSAHPLGNVNGVVVSGDGRTVYVTSEDPTNALLIFDRNTSTGAIAQLPGPAGCVSSTGNGGTCVQGTAVGGATWTVLSPDGKNAYLLANAASAVAAFARELPPVCSDGSGTGGVGASTALHLTCSDPNGDQITRTILTQPALGTLGAIDQGTGNVLYTPRFGSPGSDSFTFNASDGSTVSNVATESVTLSGTPADLVAPTITRASISPRTFAVKGGHAARVKRGAALRYTLSEASRVTVTIQRVTKGRRVGRKCRPVSRKRRGGKSCTRFVKVGTLTQSGAAGTNKKAFSGRVRHRALKPARYRAVLQATDPSGNRSKQRRLGFRIVRAA